MSVDLVYTADVLEFASFNKYTDVVSGILCEEIKSQEQFDSLPRSCQDRLVVHLVYWIVKGCRFSLFQQCLMLLKLLRIAHPDLCSTRDWGKIELGVKLKIVLQQMLNGSSSSQCMERFQQLFPAFDPSKPVDNTTTEENLPFLLHQLIEHPSQREQASTDETFQREVGSKLIRTISHRVKHLVNNLNEKLPVPKLERLKDVGSCASWEGWPQLPKEYQEIYLLAAEGRLTSYPLMKLLKLGSSGNEKGLARLLPRLFGSAEPKVQDVLEGQSLSEMPTPNSLPLSEMPTPDSLPVNSDVSLGNQKSGACSSLTSQHPVPSSPSEDRRKDDLGRPRSSPPTSHDSEGLRVSSFYSRSRAGSSRLAQPLTAVGWTEVRSHPDGTEHRTSKTGLTTPPTRTRSAFKNRGCLSKTRKELTIDQKSQRDVDDTPEDINALKGDSTLMSERSEKIGVDEEICSSLRRRFIARKMQRMNRIDCPLDDQSPMQQSHGLASRREPPLDAYPALSPPTEPSGTRRHSGKDVNMVTDVGNVLQGHSFLGRGDCTLNTVSADASVCSSRRLRSETSGRKRQKIVSQEESDSSLSTLDPTSANDRKKLHSPIDLPPVRTAHMMEADIEEGLKMACRHSEPLVLLKRLSPSIIKRFLGRRSDSLISSPEVTGFPNNPNKNSKKNSLEGTFSDVGNHLLKDTGSYSGRKRKRPGERDLIRAKRARMMGDVRTTPVEDFQGCKENIQNSSFLNNDDTGAVLNDTGVFLRTETRSLGVTSAVSRADSVRTAHLRKVCQEIDNVRVQSSEGSNSLPSPNKDSHSSKESSEELLVVGSFYSRSLPRLRNYMWKSPNRKAISPRLKSLSPSGYGRGFASCGGKAKELKKAQNVDRRITHGESMNMLEKSHIVRRSHLEQNHAIKDNCRNPASNNEEGSFRYAPQGDSLVSQSQHLMPSPVFEFKSSFSGSSSEGSISLLTGQRVLFRTGDEGTTEGPVPESGGCPVLPCVSSPQKVQNPKIDSTVQRKYNVLFEHSESDSEASSNGVQVISETPPEQLTNKDGSDVPSSKHSGGSIGGSNSSSKSLQAEHGSSSSDFQNAQKPQTESKSVTDCELESVPDSDDEDALDEGGDSQTSSNSRFPSLVQYLKTPDHLGIRKCSVPLTRIKLEELRLRILLSSESSAGDVD